MNLENKLQLKFQQPPKDEEGVISAVEDDTEDWRTGKERRMFWKDRIPEES